MRNLSVRPGYSIGHTHFIVDIEKQALVEFQRPANEISFIRDMQDLQTHYLLRFDPKTGSAAGGQLADDLVQLIKVPQLTELDPLNMSAKYGIPAAQLKGKSDFEVMVDQEALAIRRQGKLPLIDVNGEDFVVDLRMQELRHAEYFYPILSLHSFELTNDGWNYEAFYHPIMKQTVEIDPKLLEMPDHIVRIKLPNEIGLDPVSAARIYGIDERELLRRYPIQKDLKAEIIPLSETGIPRLIQQNKEKLQREHEENMRKARPRQRPRF